MAWLLILPILIFIPYLGSYWLAAGSDFSDLLISHLPNTLYLRQALLTWHTLPLWSPTILSGYPFAADPLSGLWYPPGWLAVLVPAPLGFNLAALVHMLFGGVGIYLFLRHHHLSPLPSVLGGVLFTALPKLVAHEAAGHATLVYAVAWTPWLLLAEDCYGKKSGWGRLLIGPGAVLGVIGLADVRWALPAAELWAAYVVYRTWQEGRDAVSMNSTRRPAIRFFQAIMHLAGQALLALLLAAPVLIPLAEYTRLSTRASLTAAEAANLSLPFTSLINLLFPAFGGYPERVVYPGAMTVVLALAGLINRRTRQELWFWYGVAVVSLTVAFLAGMSWFAPLVNLLGFGLLRVPARLVFLAGLGLAVITAYTAESWRHWFEDRQEPKTAALLLAGLAGFAVIFNLGIWVTTRQVIPGAMWGGVALVTAVAWVMLGRHSTMGERGWLIGLIGLAILDLVVVNRQAFIPTPALPESADARSAAGYLAAQPGLFRVYSPSYSLPQEIAALDHLELADGVDPLQLASYTTYMARATGIPDPGYSVTLPPYASGDPETDNRDYLPDATLLGRLNVRYVTSSYDLAVDGLVLKKQFGGIRVYENEKAMPRAWVEISGGAIIDTSIVERSPNRIGLEATGPGKLVLSEIAYPGWQVSIDGRSQPILTYEGILRSVDIPAGIHRIEFSFHPVSVYLGLGLGLSAWAGMIALWLAGRRQP